MLNAWLSVDRMAPDQLPPASVVQSFPDATKHSNLRRSVHPPLLKIFKRDGAFIFEGKRKAVMPQTAQSWQNTAVLFHVTFRFFAYSVYRI